MIYLAALAALYLGWLWLNRFVVPYGLIRFKLIRLPWFRLFLHNIRGKDTDRCLHSHPWPRCSCLILWGGYEEVRMELGTEVRVVRSYGPGDWNHLGPLTYHRITKVLPNTWTLVFAGRRSRSWYYFLTSTGPVDWRRYLKLPWNTDLKD